MHKLLCDGAFVDMCYVCMEVCMLVVYIYVRVCMYVYINVCMIISMRVLCMPGCMHDYVEIT